MVGKVQRFVESRGDDERRSDIIHPSELCREDFCPRAVYYRIAGFPVIKPEPAHSFGLRQILQEGSDIHHKWQTHFWDMGLLKGRFGCTICRWRNLPWKWNDTAPDHCTICGAPRYCLTYLEVPVRDDEHLIAGHADAQVGDDLAEIKSVAKGTVRVEAPQLYERYMKTVVYEGEEITWIDLEGMWRAIKRPFVTHLKQGQLYLHATGRERMIFIYECKWNQQYKEFVIRYQPGLLEDMFDMALDVKWALKTNKAPVCPHQGCAKCRSYEGEGSAKGRGRIVDARSRDTGGEGRAGKEGLPLKPKAALRDPQAAQANQRVVRRGTDGVDDAPGSVDGPYRRRIGTPGGRREIRRLSV